jgi:hypothetical protein
LADGQIRRSSPDLAIRWEQIGSTSIISKSLDHTCAARQLSRAIPDFELVSMTYCPLARTRALLQPAVGLGIPEQPALAVLRGQPAPIVAAFGTFGKEKAAKIIDSLSVPPLFALCSIIMPEAVNNAEPRVRFVAYRRVCSYQIRRFTMAFARQITLADTQNGQQDSA